VSIAWQGGLETQAADLLAVLDAAGSERVFRYQDAGERDLKGVPGTWHLWAVAPGTDR